MGLCSMVRKRKPSGRRPGTRKERPYVLIVCEGDTELNYFNALKSRFRASWLAPEKPDETNPMAILGYAVKKEKKLRGEGRNVETWVVFDSETAAIAKERSYKECINRALPRKSMLQIPVPVSNTGCLFISNLASSCTNPAKRSESLRSRVGSKAIRSPTFLMMTRYGTFTRAVARLRLLKTGGPIWRSWGITRGLAPL